MIEKIGRYEILEELGRGGMATVYLAYDTSFKRRVALKLLPEELDDPSFRPRFINEAQVIASIEHTAIVPIYDFGEENGRLFFVMRLMTGGSLADRIKAGTMSLEQASSILSAVARGLDVAHAKNIIHRDLKPANILFDQYERPYLADFGLAKKREIGSSMTGSAIIGTPAYMSPEQGGGEHDIDWRSDIYSLGVILFEMLAGRVPYISDNPFMQVIMHITSPIPSIMEFRPDLPMEIDQVLQKAMAKIKVTRYSTAKELATAVEQIITGPPPEVLQSEDQPGKPAGESKDLTPQPSTPKPGAEKTTPRPATPRPTPPKTTPLKIKPTDHKRPTPAYIGKQPTPAPLRAKKNRQPTFLDRVKAPLIITAVAVLVVVSMIAGAMYLPGIIEQFQGEAATTITATGQDLALAGNLDDLATPTFAPLMPSNTPRPTLQPTLTATLAPPPTIIPSPMPELVLPSIGGADKLGFVSFGDVYIINLDGSGLKKLTTDGGIKTGLSWAPEGQSLFYINGTCVYQVKITDASVDTILCTNWAAYLSSFRVSPDGKYVAISLSNGLFVLDYDVLKLSQIRRLDQFQGSNLCLSYTAAKTRDVLWSDDGSRLAVEIGGTDAGRPVELVRILDNVSCGQEPKRLDEFPGSWFIVHDYAKNPNIESFGWDGETIFAMHLDQLNGFGEFYRYNLGTHYGDQVKPFKNRCCFRDFSWSPDNSYMLFAFQDNGTAHQTQLYYLAYNQLGVNTEPAPLPIPEELLSDPKARPQAVLRPLP